MKIHIEEVVKKAPNPFEQNCLSRELLAVLAEKWMLLVLMALKKNACRNAELKRQIEGISQRLLTQTLRRLERYGLIERRVICLKPLHVEYSLTALGNSLGQTLDQFEAWLVIHLEQIQKSKLQFDSTQQSFPDVN
jgi:DNA-binding HxlR family transcriptional regulator